MSLIPSPRHTPEDLAAWAQAERLDAVRAMDRRWPAREDAARQTIREFAENPCYCGVSWGKDSVVVAHLVRTAAPHVPLVWVRIGARDNPDCAPVRDAFLARFPGPYEEIATEAPALVVGVLPTGARRDGYAEAGEQFGDRYLSGVRSEESRTRKLREALHGTTSARTCAPITRWTGLDVFAYLRRWDLPVHPAYAMSAGGTLERERLRVASIGGERGTGMGRREWERRYYSDVE